MEARYGIAEARPAVELRGFVVHAASSDGPFVPAPESSTTAAFVSKGGVFMKVCRHGGSRGDLFPSGTQRREGDEGIGQGEKLVYLFLRRRTRDRMTLALTLRANISSRDTTVNLA